MLHWVYRESPERKGGLVDMYINLLASVISLITAVILLAQTRKPRKGRKRKR